MSLPQATAFRYCIVSPLSRSPSAAGALTPLLAPSLSRTAGEGRGMREGVLRRAASPPAAPPFNPPSPLAAGQGEGGQRGVRGQEDLEIRKCQPILNHPTLSLAKFAKRRYNFVRRLCRRAKFPLTNRSLPRGARESRAERASMGACPRRRPSEPDLGHASGGRGSSLRNTVRPTAGGAAFFTPIAIALPRHFVPTVGLRRHFTRVHRKLKRSARIMAFTEKPYSSASISVHPRPISDEVYCPNGFRRLL